MAKPLKKLAKETAIYGISSILGKFMNWLLVPLYTYVLESSADYGVVTNLYSWTALLLVILTYGTETGFFRFVNQRKNEANRTYTTTLITLGCTSLLFALLCIIFSSQIAHFLGYHNNEFIWMLGIVVAMDAFASIPFAYLRYINKPLIFGLLKFSYVALNIIFNVFFLVVCPWLLRVAPQTVNWFYDSHYGVGYVFVSNILSTFIQTLTLIPYIFVAKFEFDFSLLKKMLRYSFPLLMLGIVGIMNHTLDKILFPYLRTGTSGIAELGIYGAISKMALVIVMFTQAFRYAYEPLIFEKKEDNNLVMYADAMKYFIITALLIFLGMVLYLDLFKYLINKTYWPGFKVIPIILFSFIFQGIFFNISIWYKLTDKNMYGAILSTIGMIIILGGNIILVPHFSYWGSALSAFVGYFIVMVLSYFWGQKHMPIHYDFKTIGLYSALTLAIFLLGYFIQTPYILINIAVKTMLFAVFLIVLFKRDLSVIISDFNRKVNQ